MKFIDSKLLIVFQTAIQGDIIRAYALLCQLEDFDLYLIILDRLLVLSLSLK